MIILWALVLVLIAGFINGSFAAPVKYMHRWKEENVWLIFSLWGFLLLPWISILVMAPQVGSALRTLPPELVWTMLLGGAAFGIGQIAFATSFRYIGLGLAFVINISMGTAGSALIPILWHQGVMGTSYSYVQLGGIFFFIVAVCLGAAAGAARDRYKRSALGQEWPAHGEGPRKIAPGRVLLGISLAIIAGLGSIGQGVTYIWVNPSVSHIAMQQFGIKGLAASTIAWVLIFSAAWVPYVLYFLILNLKNKSLPCTLTPRTGLYWLLTICMGVGFWGSLIFFSKASNVIGGDLAPTIAWPLFMVFIILTSNFWGWKSGEWKGAGRMAGRRMGISLILFVIAIVVFSYSSKLEPRNPETPEDRYHDVHERFIEHDRYPTHRLELKEEKSLPEKK